MPRYRVIVRGATAHQTTIQERDALRAARTVGRGQIVYLGCDLYCDSLGRSIKVELIADGEDEPLPRTNGEDEG